MKYNNTTAKVYRNSLKQIYKATDTGTITTINKQIPLLTYTRTHTHLYQILLKYKREH